MTDASGEASTTLIFDNDWAVIPQDPFFVPSTEDELEEFGTNVSSLLNIARLVRGSNE